MGFFGIVRDWSFLSALLSLLAFVGGLFGIGTVAG